MKRFQNLPAVALAVLLVGCVVAWYATRATGGSLNPAKPGASADGAPLIDQRLMQTAQNLAALADTREEHDVAAEALRLADHELDQAFATALREATAHPSAAPGPAQALRAHIAQIKTRVATSQQRIAQLSKDAASSDSASGQLELAKAQLALDEDELEDAQQDLARQGGDEHANLQRALEQHQAAQHQAPPAAKPAGLASPSVLVGQAELWLDLRGRLRDLSAARDLAANKAATLTREHNRLEGSTGASPEPASGQDTEDTAAVVARLRSLSNQRKTLTELDKRIQDCQQLADAYGRWGALVETRQRAALHLVLRSCAAILTILLAVVLLDQLIRHAFRHQKTDHRRLHQLRIMAAIGVQIAGALLILLILFGPPTQMTTILGLATAGLTVVMRNFIVSFFGWFVLMGKNGIHLGDWVEIEGVGGEVIEIGILKTVLLEMGNWTNTGHPTGRHVSFVNSFAIEGHYFNFSTAGQWLWDELQVMLPPDGDPYQMAEEIRAVVERETEADARQAERDWERVTHQYGTRVFSAKPAVDLRPSVNRLDVNVRYITRAPQRYEVKSRLFQKIVEMLHQQAGTTEAKPL